MPCVCLVRLLTLVIVASLQAAKAAAVVKDLFREEFAHTTCGTAEEQESQLTLIQDIVPKLSQIFSEHHTDHASFNVGLQSRYVHDLLLAFTCKSQCSVFDLHAGLICVRKLLACVS